MPRSAPISRQRANRIFEHQEPPAFLRRDLQRLRRLSPLPLLQLRSRHPDEAFAQPRGRRNAVRTAECLHTHCVDDIAGNTGCEVEFHAVGATTRGSFDHIGRRLQTSSIAWTIEVIDHRCRIDGHGISRWQLDCRRLWQGRVTCVLHA